MGALTVGSISYISLLFPAGKVIRDRVHANMNPYKLMVKRFLPFAGLAFPIMLLRLRLS
jgi:hypothetical protein